MTMFQTAALCLVVLIVGIVAPVNAQPEFEHCILKHMPGTTSDEAARAIRAACRNLHSKWESHNTVSYSSPVTDNNHNKVCQSQYCGHCSPDGKYCADDVRIAANLSDDGQYEYRFKYTGGCPRIAVSSGPSGWFEIMSCHLSVDRKSFETRIKGWTRPQVFEATLEVEKRRN